MENAAAQRVLAAIELGAASSRAGTSLRRSSTVELRPPYGLRPVDSGELWTLVRVTLSDGRGEITVFVDNCFGPSGLPIPIWIESPLGQVELDFMPESVTLEWFEVYLSSTLSRLIDGDLCLRIEADGYPDLVPTPQELRWAPPGTRLQFATTPLAAYIRWQFDQHG